MSTVTVTNFQVALEKVEELVARVNVRADFGRLFCGDKLSEIGIELAVGDHVGQALEIISGIVDAGLRHAYAL